MAQSTSRRMRHASRAASAVVLVMCSVIAAVAADGPREIDFRVAHVTSPAIRVVEGSVEGGGIGGGKPIPPSLTVAVVDTNLATCGIVHRYVSVELRNNSSTPVDIPWSPDGARVVSATAGERQVSFETLDVTLRSERKPDLFVTRELFGNGLVPGSRAILLPGEAVFLRNIALPHTDDSLCGSDIVAEIVLTSHQAVKSERGYRMSSQEHWGARSK
jgi:hypothetical protein